MRKHGDLEVDEPDVEGLRKLYRDNVLARQLLDHFASRNYNQKETRVERVLQLAADGGGEVSRTDVIDVLKTLAELGCGQFLVGRRGRPTRIAWTTDMVTVGKLATGEVAHESAGVSSPAESDETEQWAEFMGHTFHLRPDFEIELELPVDLTKSEAERLALFVRSLPFDPDT